MKSKWWLLVDIPAVFIMTPFMFLGALYCLAEIGFTFSRYHIEKWFEKGYGKESSDE